MTFEAAANAAKRAAEAAGALVDVSLSRRGSTRDSVTGERTFGTAVTVRAKIEGADLYRIMSGGSLRTARHKVTLYGEAVAAGDRLRWGGADHAVLEVDGLIRDPATGLRYNHVAVTD